MKREEKKRLLEICRKLLAAEDEEVETGMTTFFGDSKFRGKKLGIDEYNFFKPILEARYKTKYTIGSVELSEESSVPHSTLITSEYAYLAFPTDKSLFHIANIVEHIVMACQRVKYSDFSTREG